MNQQQPGKLSSWLNQRIDPALNLQLNQVARAHGVTKSKLIRDAVSRYLRELEVKNPAA